MTAPFLKNQFLLAMPSLAGDYFGGGILYLCEHNADGAMALLVNRSADLLISDVLSELDIPTSNAPASTLQAPVLVGGPVQSEHGFLLHDDSTDADSMALGQGLMLGSGRHLLEALGRGEGPQRYLLALGYAGWGPGQLEEELAANVWLSCPTTAEQASEILFDAPLSERVQRAAALLGIDFRLMAPQAGYA